jgi:inositol transport system substrate-binding protein
MKKEIRFGISVILILGAIMSCSNKKTATSDSKNAGPLDDGVLKIVHFAPDQNVAQKEFSDNIKVKINEFNSSENFTIEYQIFNAQLNTQTQIDQIETALVKDYDVFLIFAVDSEGTAPIVKQVQETGKIIIDICDIGYPDYVSMIFYGNNEPLYADLRDRFLDKYLADNPTVHLNTGIIHGTLTQLPQLPRGDRMKDYAKSHPDRVTILDAQSGEWFADKAMNITEDWLQAYPTMNFICSANDDMTVGIIQALKASGVLNRFLVTSIDCTDEALEMIRRGELGCTIGVDNYDYASEVMDVVIRMVKGEKFEKKYYMENIRLITKDNVEEYIKDKSERKRKMEIE